MVCDKCCFSLFVLTECTFVVVSGEAFFRGITWIFAKPPELLTAMAWVKKYYHSTVAVLHHSSEKEAHLSNPWQHKAMCVFDH